MEIQTIYEQILNSDNNSKVGLQVQDKEKAQNYRGRCRCLLVMMVSLGLFCVALLIFITMQHISFTADRDLIKKIEKNITILTSKYNNLYSSVYFFISTDSKTWSESREFCRDYGGDLVIKTEEKQRFITSVMKENMWIGLSDIETEGKMIWMDNSPLIQSFWNAGEPNNFRGIDEDCVEMNPFTGSVNNWNDLPCNNQRRGICEK